VDIQVMPKMGDTSTTYPQSQWPFYVRQGNCSPADVYKGLAIKWTTTLGPAPAMQQRTLAQWSAVGYPAPELCAALRHLLLADSRTVIRTGYGIFYTQDIGNAYFDMARNIAGRV
jgi:hypothetical protein